MGVYKRDGAYKMMKTLYKNSGCLISKKYFLQRDKG